MVSLIKSILKILKLIVFTIFIALVITLCVNNSQSIALSLSPLPYQVETKLFLLIILFFTIGVIVGILVNSISVMKRKVNNFMNKKKLNKMRDSVPENRNDRNFI